MKINITTNEPPYKSISSRQKYVMIPKKLQIRIWCSHRTIRDILTYNDGVNFRCSTRMSKLINRT